MLVLSVPLLDHPVHMPAVYLPLLFLSLLILKQAFLSPLRHLPGPWYTSWTGIVLRFQALKGYRSQWVDELHRKYGPVVRIAPDEVDVCDFEGYREIHKFSNPFLKAPWYIRFREAVNCFTATDPHVHVRKRRLLSRPFSKSSLREHWEPTVRRLAAAAVQGIKKEAAVETSDAMKWWTFMATDVTGALVFSESFGMTESGQKSKYIEELEFVNKARALRLEIYGLYCALRTFTLGYFDPLTRADQYIEKRTAEVVQRASERQLVKANIFAGLKGEKSSDETMADREVLLESIMLIVAGSGTTAVTMTFLTWAVMANPEIQSRLEEEVATLSEGFTDSELEAQPYLNAVINEALRLYGAAPFGLPRIVPATGFSVCGHRIPGGAIVTTQSFSLHRDGNVWAEPDQFIPERWLEKQQHPEAIFAPFGGGSRTCIGLHMAQMELRLATALLFRECAGIKLAPSTTPESMEIVQYSLIAPKGRKCEVML
ncbi:cytochrome P450 [Aspergillus vadensis CBS 113365]|uniref:Cytochrome P450 n=1 Tax=Aspergillus vadensis (strain CBS 113365 / IMI 142717 / IBT 24658) TaxID=1448311 RepID=A0A319BUT6_ASPVC|nr:cytochrome P450 [Aspergillus vadensis CBS 113365]PYH75080.1 cytochrome P450 [Aspergillus vadensis CBS 113365]